MIIEEDEYLAHYGILRRSGRYPWNSGDNENKPQSHINRTFLDTVNGLRKQGMTDVEICRSFDIKDKHGNITDSFATTNLRAAISIAKNEERADLISQAQRLKAKGVSTTEIGNRLGKNESTIRSLLAPGQADKASAITNIADMLQKEVADKKFIDVGEGVSYHVGVSKNTFDNAVAVLKEKGYSVHTVPVEQLGTGKKTNVKVLAPPDTPWGTVAKNSADIKMINHKSKDMGRSVLGIVEPLSIDPKRVGVRYAGQGGEKADGVIYVRPGVKDVSIGNSLYAQVRVQVGDGHYLKGMAVYKHDLPPGKDLVFNTSKHDTGNKFDSFKELKRTHDGKIDKDNPFGSTISDQITEVDRHGNRRTVSSMNIVNEAGAWGGWSKTLSSQMLSKQTPSLAKEQLDKTHKQRQAEFERLSKLTNPEVRKKLLIEFGDSCDSAAVNLKAAGMPRTHGHHVLLPIDSMKPNEVYAPNYRDGETVVLIRHPHGGTFEIPRLVVNNRNMEAKKLLGTSAIDAIGIHHKVAERLSGADFDGDTVLVIPDNRKKIVDTPSLERLKGFDPRAEYKGYPGMKVMKKSQAGTEMGNVTNLITDMTVKGAPTSEIVRAVRHSMVIIDAHKHKLNYKQSALDHGIPQLKEKYQGGKRSGASTLISRATSETRVPSRSERRASLGGPIDKKTGQRIYEYAQPKTRPDGSVLRPRTEGIDKLALTDNAHTLSSGTPMEKIYADHSNRLKDLANASRKEGVNTPNSKYSQSARKVYRKEYEELNAAISLARRNAPLERQAQISANAVYHLKLHQDPSMDDETKKKVKFQALTEARNRMGAKKDPIEITPRQWEAIQAGAISSSMLQTILSNANMDKVQEYATPRAKVLSSSKMDRAKLLLDKGYTRAQVADKLGVSKSTLDRELANA